MLLERFTKLLILQKSVKHAFLGFLAAWKWVGKRNLYVTKKTRRRGWYKLDVPEVSPFRVKIHKNVNFSALAGSRLLNLHNSSGSNAVCTNMPNFNAGVPAR